ncbi:hypothetical protein [Paenibacillus dakarensis]|nr:hypothetical protein [Paenibacillus dakarensis]
MKIRSGKFNAAGMNGLSGLYNLRKKTSLYYLDHGNLQAKWLI